MIVKLLVKAVRLWPTSMYWKLLIISNKVVGATLRLSTAKPRFTLYGHIGADRGESLKVYVRPDRSTERRTDKQTDVRTDIRPMFYAYL